MDEATLILLSRHVDGDLSPDEAARLEERLSREPELREELARLGEVRAWLGELGSSEEPPKELDALVAPLRLARAPRPLVRPAYRWLAAAACVVIGVAVGVEVAQRRPPQVPAAAGREASSRPQVSKSLAREPFQLQALPTAPPDEDRPLGAAERLLASPPPEAALQDLPALEPAGPLEAPPQAEEAERKESGKRRHMEGERRVVAADATGAPAPAPAGNEELGERAGLSSPQRQKATLRTWAADYEAEGRVAPPGAAAALPATLELWAASGVRTARAWVSAGVLEGRYRVVVRIDSAGMVVSVRPSAVAAGDRLLSDAGASALLGVAFDGLASGEYHGVLSAPPTDGPRATPTE